MKKFIKCATVIPFVLGIVGFYMSGYNLKDAAFTSVLLYLFNYGDSAPNILVEIARWLAPLATAGWVLTAFSKINTLLHNIKTNLKNSDSVAVYGDNDDADYIRELYKKTLIKHDGNQFVKADRYVLYGTDEENLLFYSRHKEELSKYPVCLRTTAFNTQDLIGDRIIAFNPSQIAASLFWKENDFYAISKERNHNFAICIIGFGDLGKELLVQGLQNNIFSPNQKIEYHIFGEDLSFKNIYHQINKIEDTIEFHSNWADSIELLSNSIVIVAPQDNQYELVHDVLLATTNKNIFVISQINDSFEFLDEKDRLTVFDLDSKIITEENLFNDNLIHLAKKINLRYASIYNRIEETDENLNLEWKKLNAFTKCSNISAADYHLIRQKMLIEWNVSSFEQLSNEQLELLSELEHIRWCRYHYLSNWKLGTPENGKNKDFEKRVHTDLVPYNTLSEEDKEKDRENIRILLSL